MTDFDESLFIIFLFPFSILFLKLYFNLLTKDHHIYDNTFTQKC